MAKKYQHVREHRGIGFVVRIASILFSHYLASGRTSLSQSQIVKAMGIPLPNFYRHMSWDRDTFKKRMKMVGVSREKIGNRVFYNLDVDVYKSFIQNS